MLIKIYFGNKPLFLTSEVTPELEPFRHHDDTVFIDELSAHAVNAMLHEMRAEKVHAGILLHPDLPALKRAIWKKFLVLQAAGGLVINEKKELLFILRRGFWDLPKGKLEAGENLEDCAIREVEEETGLRNVILDKLLITTFHTYDESGKHILKESHWYLMHVEKAGALVPQTEEDITEIRWVKAKDLDVILKNTFPSIIDVVQEIGLINN